MTGFYIIGNLAFNGLTPCIENNKKYKDNLLSKYTKLDFAY